MEKWSSHQPHTLQIAGSNPAPGTLVDWCYSSGFAMSEERLKELQVQLQGAMTYMATKRRRPQMLAYIDRLKAEIRSLGRKPGKDAS